MPITKTALPELTDTAIALKDLTLHPLNARAGSPDAYEADDIPVLAASIAALGLLNPLIVQKTEVDGKPAWGVLAGGRRLAAMRQLCEDKNAKGWTARAKIACRTIGDDVAAATAITVAENVTQAPMDPLDEFEAFARMMETGGHDIDSIAALFGVERRRVTERLRYGRVHPDIRRAARAKDISLDVMKAFAAHPDHGMQWAVFEATEGQYRQAWTIRDRLEKAGIKLGSGLGRYVEAEYRAADGPITADLIVEDSVLTDEALVDRLLVEKLTALAKAERARLGFAWAEGRRTADYEALRVYGRTYPSAVEPEGLMAERVTEIADRLLAIDELRDAAEANDDGTDFDALENEYEALQQEHDELTTGYGPEQLEKAGVIAHWRYDGPQVIYGLIRPEDMALAEGKATPVGATKADGAAPGPEGDADEGTAPLEVAASLAADLRTERAVVIGAGLAADPALAQDLALFKIVSDLWNAHGTRISWSMGVTATRGERPHGKPDGMDQGSTEAIAALRDGVDLTWSDGAQSVTERFERFRLLDREMKARIVGVVMAEAIAPSELAHGETLLTHVAHQVVPDMRAVWRPTGEAFFGRIKKAQLLHLLATDLKQPEEAARLATAKKVDIVDYLDRLFAAPFATLTPEQREAVETWCPPGMAIPGLRERHCIEVADTTNAVEAEIEDDDETFDIDPDEQFGVGDEDRSEEIPEPEAA
ncbi:ParB/RepB/Spo0J family partition protein [Jannaschia sp. M317]|uniref:ParB/RepB/Spo0J family partition protein n=1 Tax=Jannaschia sp. M317 TaxID=2867011 RepID=UPI0021A7862A|nr:ParB/RepB/Spo0J family partition protein [Jannaschia sp. M317]UWQ19787.1 ParB/RepB/Spo0J family partition protein [Jannaschia sp. M317]